MYPADIRSQSQQADYTAQRPAWISVSPAAIASILIICDIIVSFGSLGAAYLLYYHLFLDGIKVFDTISIAGLATVIIVSIIALKDGYNFTTLADRRLQLRITLQAWLFGFFVIGWIAFLSKTTDEFSRIGVTTGFLFGLATLLIARLSLIQFLVRLAANGSLKLRSAYAIFAVSATEQRQRLQQLEREGTTLVGVAVLASAQLKQSTLPTQIEAIAADVKKSLSTEECDAVYLFLPWSQPHVIGEFRRALIPLPLPVYLFANDEYDRILSGRGMRVSSMPAFEIQRAPLTVFDRAIKRGLDIAVSLVLLVLLSPLLIMTGLAILIESGRPILYRQKRKGFGGKRFDILKFRSMTVCEDEKTFTQATRDDPRVTPLGHILRRVSIDELPQLWNILCGDMSLVGPRPHPVALDNQYDALIAKYAERQHMKPGLTGWAQVHGLRGETPNVATMEARVAHDLWYIENWSVWLDIRIILRTAFIVPFDSHAR